MQNPALLQLLVNKETRDPNTGTRIKTVWGKQRYRQVLTKVSPFLCWPECPVRLGAEFNQCLHVTGATQTMCHGLLNACLPS